MPLRLLGKASVIFEGTRTRVTNNEGVLPPQITPVGGRLSNFVEGWKCITNDPFVLSIVAKGYRLRFTSPPLLRQNPWEIRSPQGPQEILGMREQITLMLKKNAITEVPPNSPGIYSNVFLVRKASGGWRPVIDLKNLNAHIHAPHFRMFTTTSVLSSVRKGDYAFKIDLQDVYFHAPSHPSSRKYLSFILNRKKSKLDPTEDLQFLGIRLRLDLGEASLPESKAWEIVARARHLSSLRVLTYSQVSQLMGSLNWASGLIQMGRLYLRPLQRHFHSLGLTDQTLWSLPTYFGPKFSYLRNPDPHISGGPHDFYGRLHAGVGRSHGGFQDFGYLDPYRPQAPYQLSGAQRGHLCPTALGSSASGPPGYDRHGQFDSSFIYQQTRRDSLPNLVMVESRSFPLVRGSEHNSPGKAYSRLSERDSRPPISPESANIDRVVPPPRDRATSLQGFELPPSSVHVSNSGAKSPSVGCSVSGLAGEVNVHVSPIPPAQQSHSEASIHSGGRGSPRSPLVADSIVVFTSTTSLCGTPPSSSLLLRSSVPTGSEVHLGRKVVQSARMEALMRHYKVAGFSKEVSRLAAAPRRPSTNRMYRTTINGFASLDGPQDKGLIHLIPQLLR